MNPNDILNECETKIVEWLQTDADVSANYVHEKYVKDVKNYRSSQIPAVGVHCYGITPVADCLQVEGNCEVITTGGKPEADTQCKQVVAEIYQSFQKQFIASLTIETDFKDVNPINAEAVPARLTDGFVNVGSVRFQCKILQK